MADDRQTIINTILELDSRAQDIFRTSWPESWLRLNLPLGSSRALLAIEGRDAHTPGKVADALGVSRTTVTGMLDRLEAEGLLTRTVDPADRRCFVLQLTPRGQELVREINGNRREHMARAVAVMSPEKARALREGLAALVEALHSSAEAVAEKQAESQEPAIR